eukprot:Skav234042  [mRNA]  locus=scaffold461:140203:145707:- [translate_table: standard]
MAEMVEYQAERYFGNNGRPRVVQDMLGESPCWDHRTETLYWVDILGMAICSYKDQSKEVTRWHIGEVLGFVAFTEDVDVLIFGGAGAVTVSNGLGWSPDHRIFYYIDSPTLPVRAYDYDLDSGSIVGSSKVAFSVTEGAPDGMCVDSEGFLWVLRVNPNSGTVVARIVLPVSAVTSVCFGGPYFRTLFITTAMGTSDADVAQCSDPNAGQLYAVEVDVPGMPMTPLKLEGKATSRWDARGGYP